jgi:hypothetical protein
MLTSKVGAEKQKMRNPPHADIKSWGGKAKNEKNAPNRQQKLGRKNKKGRIRPEPPTKIGAEKQKRKKPPNNANLSGL